MSNVIHQPREAEGPLDHGLPPGVIKCSSTLGLEVHKADGTVIDRGIVSRRVVTRVGVQEIVRAFSGLSTPVGLVNFKWHQSGTGGAVAATSADTDLNTQYGVARVSGTQTNPAAAGDNYYYYTEATVPYTSSVTVNEHGIFSSDEGGTDVLFDRHTDFSQAVNNGDSLVFKYTLTVAAAG